MNGETTPNQGKGTIFSGIRARSNAMVVGCVSAPALIGGYIFGRKAAATIFSVKLVLSRVLNYKLNLVPTYICMKNVFCILFYSSMVYGSIFYFKCLCIFIAEVLISLF